MPRYEYKVIPAPVRGEKVRGSKTTADRFALTLTGLMNELGRDGWEYQRADTLPCEERVGLTGRQSTFQNMLVFRRELAEAEAVSPVFMPLRAEAPATAVPLILTPAANSAPALGPALGPVRGHAAE
ncbi:DUF4177 domain-containing protein [Paracoccaceae bacterium Fryx2]|nr:DUF4177 domain-containing protein [Paracoccaceae bacterium Fryx2]